MGLTKLEQETIINFNAEEATANIYTATPVMIRKMDKLLEKYPNEVKLIRKDEVSKTFVIPFKWVTVRPRTKKNLTAEYRKELAERLKANKKKMSNERELDKDTM